MDYQGFRRSSARLGQTGFTLVETMITMGVASLVFLGTTAVVLDSAKQKRRSDAGAQKLSLDQEVRLIFRNRGMCSANVKNIIVSDTDETDFVPSRGRSVAGTGNFEKGEVLMKSSSSLPSGYLAFSNVLVSQPKLKVISRSNDKVLLMELTYESGVSEGNKLGQALNRSNITFWARATHTSGPNWRLEECASQESESGELTGQELCDRLDSGRKRFAYDDASGTCQSVAIGVVGSPGATTSLSCPAGYQYDGPEPKDTSVVHTGIALIDSTKPGCLAAAVKLGGVPGCESSYTGGHLAGVPTYMTTTGSNPLPPATDYIRIRCIPIGTKRLNE